MCKEQRSQDGWSGRLGDVGGDAGTEVGQGQIKAGRSER